MNTMNYEQKYKEAFKVIESLYNAMKYQSSTDALLTSQTIEKAFPEFCESEDERIKRCISDVVRKYGREFTTGTVTKEKMLAWLEKQGEQKPIDKVEPKFKVGDWVVLDNKIFCHIDNIYQGKESLMYTITDTKDMTRGYSVKGFDNNAHLWTIKDAKDGYVLITDSRKPFIFKGCLDKRFPNSPVAYCGIDTTNRFCYCICNRRWTNKNVYPAIKEQRDLLFQNMKEAGYEWDAEKKELKKIEQNPTWSEEYEKILKGIKDNIQSRLEYSPIEQLADMYSKEISWLKSFKDRVQPKQELSEENEKNYQMLQKIICDSDITANLANKLSDWLKSLKDRIQPSKKQEWSEED